MNGIKAVSLILAACLLLTGCAAHDNKAKTEQAPAVSMQELSSAMLSADKSLPEMKTVTDKDENAADLFGYLSDFDYDKVEAYFLSYAADGQSYEIAVVALKDADDAEALKSTLKKHCKNRVNLYQSYAPDQVQRAEAAELAVSGGYVALIMCDDQEAVKKAFQAGIG